MDKAISGKYVEKRIDTGRGIREGSGIRISGAMRTSHDEHLRRNFDEGSAQTLITAADRDHIPEWIELDTDDAPNWAMSKVNLDFGLKMEITITCEIHTCRVTIPSFLLSVLL